MGHEEHKMKAPESVRCAVITVSDSRDIQEDRSGERIREMLMEEGHEIVGYEIANDDVEEIKDMIGGFDADVYILNGGTGISRRDVTIEALREITEKEIPGFGELFRTLSYEDIGSSAMMSRASAGTLKEKIFFALPGSTAAVELAMEELILPELGHLVHEVNK